MLDEADRWSREYTENKQEPARVARSYSGSSTLNAVCTFCYTSTLGACVQSYPALCDPVTVARQAPLSMGLSRQEYWSGWPFPTPGDLSDPGPEPMSPVLVGGFFTTGPPGKPLTRVFIFA